MGELNAFDLSNHFDFAIMPMYEGPIFFLSENIVFISQYLWRLIVSQSDPTQHVKSL